MTGATHLAVGLALASCLPDQNLPMTAAIALGSIIPDIDNKTSLVGRYIPVLPHILTHRGLTHYPLVALLVGFLNLPLAIGMASHLVLDMLNPDGLPLLGPFCRRKISIPVISFLTPSGGLIDKLLAFGMWAFVLYRYASLACA